MVNIVICLSATLVLLFKLCLTTLKVVTMETILTPKQAKKAREEVGLSQGNVAVSLGINRTYLSLFESGKYIFDDDTLEQMSEFYIDHGAEIESPDTLTEGGMPVGKVRIMDGFMIADHLPDEEVENLLGEYAFNTDAIESLRNNTPKEGFWGIDEDDLANKQNQILALMARNFCIIEQLHGHESIKPCHKDKIDGDKKTTGDFISAFLSTRLSPLSKASNESVEI